MHDYTANEERYERPAGWFRRCGTAGLQLPAVSLGCWHNFGGAGTDPRRLPEVEFHRNCQQMLFTAFDAGVTHFDLANNYGPPPGDAEARVGRILREDFGAYRDELIVSSKAGYRMWPGPYGEGSSRKYLLASLDQSLQRLGLDYVDVFYSHRFDPETPLEETLCALDSAVRQGKALHVGISSYSGADTHRVATLCAQHGWVQPVIHQPVYSLLERWVERELLPVTTLHGLGTIAFCPLAQGLLTDKYLDAIPEASRVRQADGALNVDRLTPELIAALRELNTLARDRGQSLAQFALAWVLRDQPHGAVTSALIGASRPEQVAENVRALDAGPLDAAELERVEQVLSTLR